MAEPRHLHVKPRPIPVRFENLSWFYWGNHSLCPVSSGYEDQKCRVITTLPASLYRSYAIVLHNHCSVIMFISRLTSFVSILLVIQPNSLIVKKISSRVFVLISDNSYIRQAFLGYILSRIFIFTWHT